MSAAFGSVELTYWIRGRNYVVWPQEEKADCYTRQEGERVEIHHL